MPEGVSTHCGKRRLSGWVSAILVSEVPISILRFTVLIALIKLEKRPSLLQVTIGYSHFVSVLAVIDQGSILGLLARPMAVRPRLETRSPSYFPRRSSGFLATASLQNTWMSESSTLFRSFGFRLRAAAISGHASPGNGPRTKT
jgi:hypothetical protein